MKTKLPILALTLGDSAGIGPELVLKSIADPAVRDLARFVVVGDVSLLQARAKRLGLLCDLPVVRSGEELNTKAWGAAAIDGAARGADESVLGREDKVAGRASMQWLEQAARLALSGDVGAIVTAPINKQAIQLGGYRFEGHTEFLGELSGAEPVMMLVGGGLRVALVTRHCALREVFSRVTEDEIIRTSTVVASSMQRDFGIKQPRIGILALNPHASDGGRFGDEEKTTIEPAIKRLKSQGIAALGPLVPDVAFWHALRGQCDAIVAMYHDQGLIPLKTLAFDLGVNVTLGLPIVRTSPDHGTAFDIAGKGLAGHASFNEAIKLAARMATNRQSAPEKG
jgi:4-hydroxythreonine-4-phosphate dehydrogenase